LIISGLDQKLILIDRRPVPKQKEIPLDWWSNRISNYQLVWFTRINTTSTDITDDINSI